MTKPSHPLRCAAMHLSVMGVAITLLPMISGSLQAQATHEVDDWSQSVLAQEEIPSLRDFQKTLGKRLQKLSETDFSKRPVGLTARVTAESRTGIRRLQIRNFQILSDGAREVAEFELGAGSWPSVVGAMGSAIAGDLLIQSIAQEIPLDGLEVVFTSRPGRATSATSGNRISYPQNLSYIAFIDSPASDAQLEEMRLAAESASSVLQLVSREQIIPHGELIYRQTAKDRDGKTIEGLREFLEDKRAASSGAKPPESRADAQLSKDLRWQPPLRARVKVEGATGIRHIRTDLRNFQVLHDFPSFLGGHNLGPVPEEHILGTMITCLTHIYEIEAAKRGVALDTLELEVAANWNSPFTWREPTPSLTDLRYSVRISSPESKETIEELQKSVESVCPIYNMLKNSQPISGTIVRGRYSLEAEKGKTR